MPETLGADPNLICGSNTAVGQYWGFDLNDLLDDDAKMKLATDYSTEASYFDVNEEMSNYVGEFSKRLRKYGCSFLEGDFSLLPRMEQVIKDRAKTLNS